MSANAAAPTGRKILAQGKERSDATLSHDSQNTSSPEGAKEVTDREPHFETGKELLAYILAERRRNWGTCSKYKEPSAAETGDLPAIPKGWTWASLGQLSRSSSYGTSAKCSPHNSGPPVLRIPNIAAGRLDFTDLKFAGPSETIDAGDELAPGDLLIIRTNGSRNLIGRSAVVRSKLERATNYASYLIRFRLAALPTLFDWVGTIWDASFLRAWIEQRAATSAGQHNISMSVLSTMPFPLPPLPEQRRIVAEIEKQFTRLEAGVAALQRVQVNLKRYRAAVLKAACEGKLVPTEAELTTKNTKSTKKNSGSVSASSALSAVKSPGYETGAELLTRILAERRKNWLARHSLGGGGTCRGQYKEPAAPDTANLPPLPEGWTWASVEQITENFDGRRVPLKSADRDKRSGEYPYYGASGVIDDIDDFLFDGDFLLIAEDGANLLSRSTPIAFKASGKFWANNHAHIVQTHGGIPLSYLEIFLNGKDLTFSVTGSAQPKLTQAAMNKIHVPLPPLAEQTRIVAEVERRLSVVEELEAVVSANLQRATRLRQSILQKAFTGKLC